MVTRWYGMVLEDNKGWESAFGRLGSGELDCCRLALRWRVSLYEDPSKS